MWELGRNDQALFYFEESNKFWRGYDEETEEFVGGVEELSGAIADLTKTASKPGGISLFTDETKTEYKSTYQILKDISEIYDELTDKQQAKFYLNVQKCA